MRGVLLGIFLAFSRSIIKKDDVLSEKNVVCPSPEEIAPCLCWYDVEVHLQLPNMDCAAIEDDNVLENVFKANFPVKVFHIFNVHNSHGLQNLKNGVFGEITFEVIIFDTTRLENVEREVFVNSVSTLKELRFIFNNIRDDFPFDILKDYVALEKFEVNSCENTNNFCLTQYPILDVPQLKYLTLSDQSFDVLPDDPFRGIPNIKEVVITQNHLTEIPFGIFENLNSLEKVSFGVNKLSNLSHGLFTMNSENLTEIGLQTNHIEHFHQLAFSGFEKSSKEITLNLFGNGIKILERIEFEYFLSRGIYIQLKGNPLDCGCDIDWLIFHTEYHKYVADAECYVMGGNELLIDQDPSWYEANC